MNQNFTPDPDDVPPKYPVWFWVLATLGGFWMPLILMLKGFFHGYH